jgi:hypothetical protein
MEFERVAAEHARRLPIIVVGIMVIGLLSLIATKGSGAVVILFFAAFVAAPYLYAQFSRLPCPNCGRALNMKLGEPVIYTCSNCRFNHETDFNFTSGGGEY